jgi:hypothetical protein
MQVAQQNCERRVTSVKGLELIRLEYIEGLPSGKSKVHRFVQSDAIASGNGAHIL